MRNNMSRRDFLKLGAVSSAITLGGNILTPFISAADALKQQNLASHVTIGNTSVQANLNPYGFIYFQARQIYDTLIDVTADGQLIPSLATEWNRVDDQTLEIKLRDDVFFSNGEQFTSNSVKFTIDFLRSQIAENFFAYFVPISDLVLGPPSPLFDDDSIEIIDDYNLVIRLTRPDAILEKRLSRLFVLSEQYMTESGNDMSSGAVGTGYFRIADFAPGERIDFETWEGNWRGSLPIQTATYVTVGDLRTALESGDIDIAQSLPPDIARDLVDSGDWLVSQQPALATGIINLIPDTHPAMDDPNVRRALNLAINKQEYNDIILAGFGVPTNGQLLPPGFDGHDESLEGFPYDPEEARRLLSEAGYNNLQLSMLAPNTARVQAEALTAYFQAVGVNVALETPDSNTVISEVSNRTDFNMVFWDSNYVTLGDWSQAAIPFTFSPNQPHIGNERFYELNSQIVTAGDPVERTQLIQEVARLMNEEASVVFLSWKDFYYIHTPRIQSVPFNLDTSPRIYAIEMTTS